MTLQEDLAQRYGAPAPWQRRVLIASVVLLALVSGGWLAWTSWSHATPEVDSELETFSVDGEYSATAVVLISLRSEDVTASCTLRAFAEDHTTVGELRFEPDPAAGKRQTFEIRTERRATSVEFPGCTAPGQPRQR